jgi:thiol-disulfide isomerase/thioredoxin
MKILWWIIGIVVVVGGLVAALVLAPLASPPMADPAPSTQTGNETPIDEEVVADGRFVEYQQTLVDDMGYNETILFFYASWCPECRAFEQAINSGDIPAGVQILRVNYDTEDTLKTQHQVTLQSTFVRVDADGQQISKWVGYGQDKSLNAIRDNT